MIPRSGALAIVGISACTLMIALPIFAYAQFNFSTGLPGEANDLSIILTPANPSPGQIVQLTAQSSYIDLSQSSLTWYQNGAEIAEGEGVTSTSMQAGGLGSQMTIELSAQAPDGTLAQASTTIIPTSIDLLFDSDSYVPPFYQGRALPSAGTNVRLQAIPHFEEPGGAMLSASALTYTWSVDNRTLTSLSGKGKSSAIIPSATLYDSETISVTAVSSDLLSGSASITLPATTPILMLYEDNPLFGVMYHQALGAQTSIPDTEMTFAAVPYFAQAQSPNDPQLQWSWSVNNETVAPNSADPSEITINAANSTGAAAITAEVTRPSNIFMDANGSWQVTLGTTGSRSSALQQATPAQSASIFGQ